MRASKRSWKKHESITMIIQVHWMQRQFSNSKHAAVVGGAKKTSKEFGESQSYMRAVSTKLIRHFLNEFVETVVKIRNIIVRERNLVVTNRQKFLVVYSDVVQQRYIADTRAKVLF